MDLLSRYHGGGGRHHHHAPHRAPGLPGGRHEDIEDERGAARTVHSLKTDTPADLFHLVRRYTLLAMLVDAEYGSATFIRVDRPARFEVRVSTTELLVPDVGLDPRSP